MTPGAITPLISIVLVVHDAERFLPAAFQSILDQSMDFRLLEVLVVDDGSSDRSADMVRGYARRYSNVRAFRFDEPSGGPARGRNLGLDRATAPYVMFLDGDDAYTPRACQILLEAVDPRGADLASGFYRHVCPDGCFVPSLLEACFPEPVCVAGIEECPAMLAPAAAVWARIFRREFLFEKGIRFPEDVGPADDSVFVFEALLRARKIVQIRDLVYDFRTRGDQKDPSLGQRFPPSFFSEYATSRRAVMALFNRYTRLEYLGLCYRQDLGFTIGNLVRAGSGLRPHHASVFDSLRWFCALDRGRDLEELHPTKRAIAALIADGAYAEASELIDLARELGESPGRSHG